MALLAGTADLKSFKESNKGFGEVKKIWGMVHDISFNLSGYRLIHEGKPSKEKFVWVRKIVEWYCLKKYTCF